MSKDIDINELNNEGEDFAMDVGIEPKFATGNKLLANIFEITLLTNIRYYSFGDEIVRESFGGNGLNILGRTYTNENTDSLSGAIQTIIDRTIESILEDQEKSSIRTATERLETASLLELQIIGENVSLKIKVVPEEYEEKYIDNLSIVLPL